jgi:hypothetical protein
MGLKGFEESAGLQAMWCGQLRIIAQDKRGLYSFRASGYLATGDESSLDFNGDMQRQLERDTIDGEGDNTLETRCRDSIPIK